MDEKLIDQLYSRATTLGYKKSRNDFASLIKTDQEVYDDMLSYAQSNGLVSDATQFGSMVGRFEAPYKKKDLTEQVVGLPQQMVQFPQQKAPEVQPRTSPTPVGRGAQRQQAKELAAMESPSVDGLSVSQEIEPIIKPSVGIVTESTAVPKVDVKAIQKQKEFGDRESYWDNILNNINLGANSFDKMVASIPETAINILATPGNAIAYLTGLDIATNADKIKEQFGIRNPVLDWLNEEEKITKEKVEKFNKENYSTSGVAENIAKGNYSDAFELIGAGIAQSLPVSLTMMYGGATLTPAQLVGAGTFGFYGENAKELGEEDPNMPEIEKNLKALGMASAETVFSAIGTGTIGQVYRDLVKKEGADVAKNVLQSGLAQTYKKAIEKYGIPVGLVGEGIEEAATQITQNVISGKSPFEGAADAFILGAGSGAAFTAPISGMKAVDYISGKIEKYDNKVKIENLVKEKGTTLDKMFNVPIADDITVDQIEIANLGKSRELLLKDLEVKMKNGDITEDDAKQSLYVFDKVQQVSNAVKDLDVSTEDKATIASLLKKRDDIRVKMQNKDDVLLGREKQQIADINNQINEIILKPKEDAVQKQAAGEVPVQPTTRVSEQMAEGEPQAEPQGVTAEGVQETITAPLTQEEVTRKNNLQEALANPNKEEGTVTIGESVINIEDAQKELDVLTQKEVSSKTPEAPVVKAQLQMVQFPTATTTLEAEGTGVVTEGTEPVFKGNNAPTVNLSTDTEQRYAEDYTANEIESNEHAPNSRVVSVASNLGTGQVSYTKQGEKKTFNLPFINQKATAKIKKLRDKYRAVKGSSKEAKAEKAKLRAEINTESKKVLSDFKNTMVQNLLALYDSLTPEFIAKSKQWYVGANRMAQALAQKYNLTVDQVGGIIAALSPQNDWFNNVSVAERAIEVMTKYADTKLTKDIVDKAVAYNTDKAGEPNTFAKDLIDLFNQYGEVSINELQAQGFSTETQSAMLRAFDQALHSPKVAMTDPEGKFVGFDKTPVRWNSNTEIAKAISVFRNGSIENINAELGGGNKVRNFYNNIVDPDSETPYLTADTHALSAALNSPISANDASGIGLFNGGAEPLYALVKAAYIEAAKIAGIKPREMQSITWEAQRIGINDKNRTEDQKNQTFNYITETRENNQTPYERATELIARNRSANPSWGAAAGIETQKSSDAIREGAKLRAEQRASEISALRGPSGERVGAATTTVGGAVTGGAGVTETVKEQKGVSISNESMMEDVESRAQKDERVKSVIAAAKKVLKTLQSVIPNAQIYLHENGSDYDAFAESIGSKVKSRGIFTKITYPDGSKIVRVDINLSNASPTTVYHEVAHGVMDAAFGENTKLFSKFRDQLTSVLSKSTVKGLNEFASRYREEKSYEEWLVQFSALMSEQGKQIPVSTFQKIAEIVNKIVSQITNGAIVPFKETVSKKEVIDFFNQMSESIRLGKEITLSQKTEAEQAPTIIKAQVSESKIDKLLSDITDTVIPNAIKRKLSGQELEDLVMRFVERSDTYKNADDIQKENIIRDVRGILFKPEKKAPSVQRLLGTLKDVTKITITEKAALENQIKSLARGAKDMKAAWTKATGEITKGVKDLVRTGRITVAQASAIIGRFASVNVLDDQSVSKFVDYMDKVFKNAEYASKIAGIRKSLARAKKNIESKLGISSELKPMLREMLAINPSLVPMDVLDTYIDLVNMLSERAAVLDLAEVSQVTKDASKILEAVEEEQFKAEELKEMFDDFQDKELDDQGNVDYAKTINKMIDAGIISTTDAEIMRKYKSIIMPSEPATPMTEQEIQDEKNELINFVLDSDIDSSLLSTRAERDTANKLNELKNTNGIKSLSNTQLKNLLRVINNINNGYLPHYAQRMIEKISSVNQGEALSQSVKSAKPLAFSSMYSKLKNIVSKGKNSFETMIFRNPLFYIDQVFGDFKTKTIYKNLFEPISKAYARFASESNANSRKLDKALNDVSSSLRDNPAKVRLSKYKIMTYLLQLEYNSNPGVKGVAPAIDFINKTINAIQSGETNFNDYDAETLQEIADEFTADGQIDMQALEDSFNSAELKAIKTIQEINNDLSEKAAYTANVIRGEKFVPINNYIHHSVISDGRAKDDLSGQTIIEAFSSSRMPSSRAKSLLERTPEAKPINFDPFNVTNFVSRSQLMDYYLTEPIRTGRMAINTMKADVKGKDARAIANAIGSAYEQALENVLVSSFGKTSFADDVIDYMSTQGYRAVLAGVPRATAELLSNLSFVALKGGSQFAEGVKLRGIVMSADGVAVMNNVKSSQTGRVYADDTLSGNMIDSNMLKHAAGIKNSKSKGDVANKVNQIYTRLIKKKIQNPIEMVADALISTPDKIVTRPVWFGSFSLAFKDVAGVDPDFDKIAQNDEAYMNENREAIDAATAKADQDVAFMSATDNPFMGILKGRDTQNQSTLLKFFNRFNNYMTRFITYEYISTRTAINALAGNGDLSKKQAIALTAAVTTRMIMYSLMVQLLTNGALSMFGDDEDEEDDKSFMQKLGQAVASSATALTIGRDFGNATRTILNYGIEEINKRKLDFLREGEYDPYKDAIQFSIIPPEKEGVKPDANKKIIDVITSTLGPIAPAAKTGALIARKIFEAPKKTEEAQERREKEIGIRIPLEVLGNVGLIPFYKDVRKVVIKEIYKDLGKSSKESQIKKNMESILLQGYPTRSDMKRYDPKLYEETFGENGLEEMLMPAETIKREIKKEMDKIEREIKDDMYNYTPKKKGKKNSFSAEPFGGKPKKMKKFGE